MEVIKMINVLVRFLLELCILVIFGYWGFKTGGQPLTRFLLGIGSPILFAIVWGAFLAPKSAMRLQDPLRLIVEVVLFALAAWALYSAGKPTLTILFAILYLINKLLMLIWKQ